MKLTRAQFEQLALEQLDTVYRVARRLAREPAGAEDLVQETYLRAVRAWENFDMESYGIKPWLLRILHNLHISRSQRERNQPPSVDDEQLATAAISEDVLPLSPGSFEGMDERLVKTIDALEEQYRIVLLLWAIEDLSYKEIAEVIGIPIGTVMSRLHRARQKLTEQLRSLALDRRIIRE